MRTIRSHSETLMKRIGKDCVGDQLHRLSSKYEYLNFKTFDHTEHKMYEIEN